MANVTGVLLLLFLNLGLVWSDYILLVRTHSYDNPSNICEECQRGCCDRFNENDCTTDISYLCDTYFVYCLQSIGSTSVCTPQVVSETGWNDQPIDFSQMTVLKLPNPLPLPGVSNKWEGVELYIGAMDDDTDNNGINLPNDLIDDFLITIPNNVSYIGKETVSTYFIGRFNISLIELSFEVICAPDFIGERCEVVADDCVGPLSNCSGNGQCIDGIHSFTCKCELGFTGTHCETNIDDCASINCTGNGVCNDSINNFTCICAPGFTGSLCEIDIDDCLNVTCSNKGMCRDKVNNFTCDCDAGFGGTLCDININECAQLNVNCSGHGTCVDGVYSYHCDCEPGYTGQLCEIDIDDCVGVNCTGNRHCLDGVNRYDCVCSSEYFGTSCNIHVSHLKLTLVGGLLGTFLVLLLVMLCLMATAFIAVRQYRQKRKKYSSYKGIKHARVEFTSPMIQEDQPQRKESNIYASLTLGGKVVYPTHPDDAVVFYWNENYRAPPLKPSSLKKSVTKRDSDDIEDSMCYNPLYDTTASTPVHTKVDADVDTPVLRAHNSSLGFKKQRYNKL